MFSRIASPLHPPLLLRPRAFFGPSKPGDALEHLHTRHAYRMKRSAYLNVALGCFVFAVCFAGIPLYRVFCEHVGLVGDSSKKEYNFDGTRSTLS
jgi:hypothetical protein